jgi:hypothetical protein
MKKTRFGITASSMATPSRDARVSNSLFGILAAFCASRWLHNTDLSFSGVDHSTSSAAPMPTADHASHDNPPSGRGHALDGAAVEASSTQIDSSNSGYVGANDDSAQFSPHSSQNGPDAADSGRALDLPPFSKAAAFLNEPPLSGDVIASPSGADSLFGVVVKAIHLDQAAALEVYGAAPVGAPTFAANTTISFVAYGGVTLDPHVADPASPAVINSALAGPPGAYISDSVIHDPVGTFASTPVTQAGVNITGASATQLLQALDESGLSVNGSGIRVGVLSDSFNDLGGAAADEADGALPPAADIDVIKDLASGGTDEGRAMMQIIHEIAPGASLAFYTAFNSEQDFANGILALAAAGCKVIVDDVSYFDEPFFQNGVVAQAIQTVEAEGVTYVTAAGNDASNGYQAAWTPTSGTYQGQVLNDAESFGGRLVQTVSINTEGNGDAFPLLLEWNQAYGTVSSSTADLEMLVFNSNGQLVGTATNTSSGEPTNPWLEYDFTQSGTYYIAIENLHPNTDPGLIKEVAEGDGVPFTISGANAGTVYGHAMTSGAITAGAVSAANTPAFGFSEPVSESFSSSGAGTELLFANNGTALSSPDSLDPVVVSGIDDIHTTVSDLSDFYGTSAAAASLAGVAALILSAYPSLAPAQVAQILEASALPMANSAVSGAGLVQVDPAVADALAALANHVDAIYAAVLQAPPSSSALASLETLDQSQGDNAVVTAVVQNALGIPNTELNPAVPNFDGAATSNPFAGLTSPDLVPTLEMFQLALGYFPQSTSNLNSIVNTGLALTQLSDAFVNSQAFANVFNGGVILDPNQQLVAGTFTTQLIDTLFQSELGHLPTASTLQGFFGYTISQAFLAFAESQTYYNTELSAMTQYLTGLAEGAIVGAADVSASTLSGHAS